MKILVNYLWPVFFTFILLMIAKAIADLVMGAEIKFRSLDFLSFFVGAVIISAFSKRDLIVKKK